MEMRCRLLANRIRLPGPTQVLQVEQRVNTWPKSMTSCLRASAAVQRRPRSGPPTSMMVAPSQPRGGLVLSVATAAHAGTQL